MNKVRTPIVGSSGSKVSRAIHRAAPRRPWQGWTSPTTLWESLDLDQSALLKLSFGRYRFCRLYRHDLHSIATMSPDWDAITSTGAVHTSICPRVSAITPGLSAQAPLFSAAERGRGCLGMSTTCDEVQARSVLRGFPCSSITGGPRPSI